MHSFYYIITIVLVFLSVFLLGWAINDIIKHRKNKGIILLLILTPIIGPLIYFQTSRGRASRQ